MVPFLAEPVETEEEIIIEEVPATQNEDDEVIIPEDPNAVHLGPKTEEEAEEIQHEFEEHEEDWQRKSEKVNLHLAVLYFKPCT